MIAEPTTKPPLFELTPEQIQQYVAAVEQHAARRLAMHGTADAIAFLMGAAVVFDVTKNMSELPASWVFNAMRGDMSFLKDRANGQ
ncbi:MAG: hypothetical protein FOGNACKC_00816 [Anaerolineae bacterium]|nr:hypothetical protein [Anaerolineae bacterium]